MSEELIERFYELPVDDEFRIDVIKKAQAFIERANEQYEPRAPITLKSAVEVVLMTLAFQSKQ